MQLSCSYSQIWKIAYPILLTLLVQNLIQVTDTAFLGRVGEVELGASALAGIYYVVTFMLAFGFSAGAQILIGRRNGERNYHKIGGIVVSGIILLLFISLAIFGFTRYFSHDILSYILDSKNVLHSSLDYLNWRIFGMFFASFNVMFRAFFVGITKTKVLSINAIIMAITNTVLDYVLIFGKWGFPTLGIAGAAIASVISELLSVIFLIVYTVSAIDLKKYGFHLPDFQLFHVLKRTLNVSASVMLQYFLSLSTWLFFFLAIEKLGETALAATNLVRSLYMIFTAPVFALGATANTLVSNSIGANKHDEVIALVWKVVRMALVIAVVFMIIVALFPMLALSIYTSDLHLIDTAITSLYVLVAGMPLIVVGNIFFNSVSGTGNTRTALAIEVCTLIIYIVFVWICVWHFRSSLPVCWLSEYIYAGAIFLMSFFYLKRGNWRNRKI